MQIDVVCGGRFRLDGGAMFGPVPKVLWEKVAPADELNRIQMSTNLLVIRTGGKAIIVDTGLGVGLSEKERAMFAYEPPDATQSLAQISLDPSDVDLVIFTHLHWDHAAGATRGTGKTGEFVPTYPKATYVVQRQEYDDACIDFGTTHGGYRQSHFIPLKEAGHLRLLDGDSEVVPGVRVQKTGGHTRGHQVILLESDGRRGIYFGDIMPTTSHLKPALNMAYDLFPLDTMNVKTRLAKQAAKEEWICFWDHDPTLTMGRIVSQEKDRLSIRPIDSTTE
jgi:glyoxylase-like metal-dependent hydrolase (beta-lactamase superfamily II)